MKTVGKYIREIRLKKNLKIEDISKDTKIKGSFIRSIEREKWTELPEYPVVVGFVKRIANALHIEQDKIIALLRRDYPPKAVRINPKPDVSSQFTWSPRLTFFLGIVSVVLLVVGYLVYQYFTFVAPPELVVTSPSEGEVITTELYTVEGRTDPESTVRINNQPTLIDDMGNFSSEIEIYEGTSEIVVKSVSRSGKETVIRRSIKPEL